MTKWNKLVVYLGTNTMAAEEGMYLEGKVESGTSCGHSLDFAFWCKHEYLACKEV